MFIDLCFQNDTKGEIVEPRGNHGDKNGWDPCFKPDGIPITLGEMPEGERKRYCSRVGALMKASKLIQQILDRGFKEGGDGVTDATNMI